MFFRVFLCVFLSSFSGEKIPISKKRLFLCVIKKSDLKNIRKKEKCPPNTRRKRNARDYETLSHCSRINPLAVVAFVQRGVAEWRRVSRYRGEACDV